METEPLESPISFFLLCISQYKQRVIIFFPWPSLFSLTKMSIFVQSRIRRRSRRLLLQIRLHQTSSPSSRISPRRPSQTTPLPPPRPRSRHRRILRRQPPRTRKPRQRLQSRHRLPSRRRQAPLEIPRNQPRVPQRVRDPLQDPQP